jgi:hypothetical protein
VLNLLFDNTVRMRLEARFAAMADALRQDSRGRIASALVPMLRPAT